jgi:hypothetical protein
MRCAGRDAQARLPAALAGCILPAWAGWVAQDANGNWWGFEHEPNQGDTSWYENEVGRYVRLAQGTPNPDWTETLRAV